MFSQQITGQNHNIVMTNKSFELWQRSHVGMTKKLKSYKYKYS